MKKTNLLLTALGLAAATLRADILITEVMSSSSHPGGAGNGDWFELYNSGDSAIDLSGWSWDDDSNTPGTHSLGGVTIAAKGFVLVVDENATLIANWAADVWGIAPSASLVLVDNSMTTGFSGFGASGDSIYLYDSANNPVTSVTFGTATSGRSFAWNATGASLGISTLGDGVSYKALLDGNDNLADDNPALYAPGTDIASPGQVIPEPGVLGLLILGLGLLARRFRKN
jgi:hypothetical protein